MSVNDPIADMLTRVRNSVLVGQNLVAMPSSNIKVEIARILKEEGYIEGYEVVDGENSGPQKVLRLKLKYVGERRQRRPVITGSRAGKPPWAPHLYAEDGDPVGVVGDWHCHPLDP
jgi:small subunit ribosomal protein S8